MDRTTWYRTVYLRSDHWRKFSTGQLKKRLICEECLRAPAVELHHRRYYDRYRNSILGREKPSDMTAICRQCHDDIEEFKRLSKADHRVPKGMAGSLSAKVRRWLGYRA